MFSDSKAQTINLGDKFDTSNVKDMSYMFRSSSATTINLGDKFDTSNVTSMSYMFYISKVTKLYIPSNVKFKDNNKFDSMTYDSSKYLDSWSREDKVYKNISASDFPDKFNNEGNLMTGWWVRDEKPTSYTVKFDSNGANGLVEDMINLSMVM